MKILILTLCGQRDRVVDNLIADHLRKFGHEVYVHNFAMAGFQSVPYMKPDVIVSPLPGGEFKNEFVKQCKSWGCEVIVRRGEAGASKEIFEKMDKERQSIIISNWDYSPYVDLELTWGREFTEILAEKGCMPAEKLKACGAFSFDAYFQARRDENHEKTILFATGFSCADTREEQSDCGLPEGSPYHKVLYDQHTEGRKVWIQAIKDLVHWFGLKWRITLKVRPGERAVEYVEAFGDTVNIYPLTTSSIEALKETDILVHSGSTMAIEAHLLGIPSFNFHNINPDSLLASVCPRIETYEELEWNLARANIQQSNISEAVLRELEEHLYGKIDGKACARAARYIHEHIKNKKIKTKIPDSWPKVAKFIQDGVHIEKQKGDVRWVCFVCKNIYYVNASEQYAKCPYCSVNIKREYQRNVLGVTNLIKVEENGKQSPIVKT